MLFAPLIARWGAGGNKGATLQQLTKDDGSQISC